MKLYISGTYKMIYYLHGGTLYQIPYYLPEMQALISGPVDTRKDGVISPVKGRTREASHNRTVRQHLAALEGSEPS